MNRILYIYRLMIPEFLRDFMYERRLKKRDEQLNLPNIKKEVHSYLKSLDSSDKEILDIIEFLDKNPIKTIPLDIEVQKNFDIMKEDRMYYVDFNGKKLFFPRGTTKKTIIRYCNGIFEEQHPDSPHSYLSENFQVNKDSIIADIGAAEGNFSLSIIDKVKKVYIFEADNIWEEALKKTFKPWKDKVELVFSKVSDKDEKGYISLDEFFKNKPFPNFLKLDVEGSEDSVLRGGSSILKQDNIKVDICTYHYYDDDKKFKAFFEDMGYSTQFSNSYMILYGNGEDFKKPYIRRGVLRAEKSKTI
ncbi:MAG: FkbM family methyltransferase [Bacteroidales bacterium]|nr:FkbM family methyltransferase [Bacteroidales bacterium]